ncbi:MAG: hypothetical protein ABIQ81_00210 [Novosphingobium sp.]
MTNSQFAASGASLSTLDRAIFVSISVMSMFALFSPILAIGR